MISVTADAYNGGSHHFRSLDLSQGAETEDEEPDIVNYAEPEENLAYLMANLPELVNLDLSGTNLPGFQKIEQVSHRLEPKAESTEVKCVFLSFWS